MFPGVLTDEILRLWYLVQTRYCPTVCIQDCYSRHLSDIMCIPVYSSVVKRAWQLEVWPMSLPPPGKTGSPSRDKTVNTQEDKEDTGKIGKARRSPDVEKGKCQQPIRLHAKSLICSQSRRLRQTWILGSMPNAAATSNAQRPTYVGRGDQGRSIFISGQSALFLADLFGTTWNKYSEKSL